MDYWKEKLTGINAHIKLDCDPENKDYCWIRRGIIVVDDESGEKLAFVKEQLGVEELKRTGKVKEITVDKSWPLNNFDKCWDMLLAEARKSSHGLLVINVEDIKIFNHCWCIKQLAKQEDPALQFNEYVLLVIKGITWAQVKEFANERNKGEFEAMLQFYSRVTFETE